MSVSSSEWFKFCAVFQSYLPGFYDPCPGKEKRLKIVYLFKCELHEAVFGDLEVVRIPKMCE